LVILRLVVATIVKLDYSKEHYITQSPIPFNSYSLFILNEEAAQLLSQEDI